MTLQQLAWSARRRWWLVVLIVCACVGLAAAGVGANAQQPVASAQVRVVNDLNVFGTNFALERQSIKALEDLNGRTAREQAVLSVLGRNDADVVDEMSATRTTDSDVITVRVTHRDPTTASLIANAWVADFIENDAQRLAPLEAEIAALTVQRTESFNGLTDTIREISAERDALARQAVSRRVINVPPAALSPALSAQQARQTAEFQSINAQIVGIRADLTRVQVHREVDLAPEDGSGTTIASQRFGLFQWLVVGVGLSLLALAVGTPSRLSSYEAQAITPTAQLLPPRTPKRDGGSLEILAALVVREQKKGTRVFALSGGRHSTVELSDFLTELGFGVLVVSTSAEVRVVDRLTRADFERVLRGGSVADSDSLILVELPDVRAKESGPRRREDVVALVELRAGETTEREASHDLRLAGNVADETIALVA